MNGDLGAIDAVDAPAPPPANRAPAGGLLRRFGFLIAGRLLGDLFTFLLFVALSRRFGENGVGQYSFAVALTGFAVVFCDFGLYPFTIKELSRRGDTFKDYYSGIISLRLLLSVAVLAALVLCAPLLPFPRETTLIILVVGAFQILARLVEGTSAVFVAHEEAHLAGLIEASFKLITAVSGILAVLAGAGLVASIAIVSFVAVGPLIAAYAFMSRRCGHPNFFVARTALYRVVRESFPYAVFLFVFQVYSRVDVVSLGFLRGTAAAGIYNAAYRVIFLLLFVPLYFSTAVLPQASRLHSRSPRELQALFRKIMNGVILVGLPAVVGLWLIAPELVRLLYGRQFAESIPVLRLLAALLVLTSATRMLGMFLMACDRQGHRTSTQWWAASFSLVLNLMLIPRWGVLGAAVAVVAAEGLLVVLLAASLRPVLGWPPVGSRAIVAALGAAAFALPGLLLPRLPLAALIPVAVVIYLGVLMAFKEIREDEGLMLIRLFRVPSRS